MSRKSVKPTSALARRSVTARRVANPGVTQLRKDADQVVGKKSKQIAKSLAKQAVEGNASSARLLVDLADGANWTEHSDSVAQVVSLAMNEWNQEKKEPETVELQLTTNPPKQFKPPAPPRLTDGKSAIIDAEVTDAEPAP